MWRGEANLHKDQVATSEFHHEEPLGELQVAHEQLEQERSTVTKLRTQVARVTVEMKQIEVERDRAKREAEAAHSVTSIARREADTVKAELKAHRTQLRHCARHTTQHKRNYARHMQLQLPARACLELQRAGCRRGKIAAKLLEGELETAQLLAQTWKGRTERLVVRAKAVAAAGASDKLPNDLGNIDGDDSAADSSSNKEDSGKLSSTEQLKELARQQLAQLSSLELELAEESVLHSEQQRKAERETFEVSTASHLYTTRLGDGFLDGHARLLQFLTLYVATLVLILEV